MMKTIELVTCEDYVLACSDEKYFISHANRYKVYDYARLLKQPITLGMFVPCDEDGNLLEEPKDYDHYSMMLYTDEKPSGWVYECEKYHAALDRVIFEGFEVSAKGRGVIVIKHKDKRLSFSNKGIIFEYKYKSVQTISDLCGYGLKIKMR